MSRTRSIVSSRVKMGRDGDFPDRRGHRSGRAEREESLRIGFVC